MQGRLVYGELRPLMRQVGGRIGPPWRTWTWRSEPVFGDGNSFTWVTFRSKVNFLVLLRHFDSSSIDGLVALLISSGKWCGKSFKTRLELFAVNHTAKFHFSFYISIMLIDFAESEILEESLRNLQLLLRPEDHCSYGHLYVLLRCSSAHDFDP